MTEENVFIVCGGAAFRVRSEKSYKERTSQSEGPTTDREPQKYEGDTVGRPQPVIFRLTVSIGKDRSGFVLGFVGFIRLQEWRKFVNLREFL